MNPRTTEDHRAATQRLAEVAEILAAGILRLRSRQLGTHRVTESRFDWTSRPSEACMLTG